MKKILFYILGVALFTACSNDEQLEEVKNTQANKEVAFTLSVNQAATRAGGTNQFPYVAPGTKADMRIILEVYPEGGESPVVRVVNNDATEDVYDAAKGFDFPGVHVTPGATYKAVFWADFGKDYYNADDLRNIEQKNLNINLTQEGLLKAYVDGGFEHPLAHIADVMDAYSGQVDFTVDTNGKISFIDGTAVADPANIPVTLTRPLSKLMFCHPIYNTKVETKSIGQQWDSSFVLDIALAQNKATTFQMVYKEDVYSAYDALNKKVLTTGAKRNASPALIIKDFTEILATHDAYVEYDVFRPTMCDYVFMDGSATNTTLSVFPKIVWDESLAVADGLRNDLDDLVNYYTQFVNLTHVKYYGAGTAVTGGTVPFVLGLDGTPNKLYRMARKIDDTDVEDKVNSPLRFYEVLDASIIPVLSGTPGSPSELG